MSEQWLKASNLQRLCLMQVDTDCANQASEEKEASMSEQEDLDETKLQTLCFNMM